MASCPFCRIARGEQESAVVFEDRASLAFLDRRPLFPGHSLVVPRAHVETLADLPLELVSPLFVAVRLVARAVETALRADGSFVAINNRVSQSVQHLHVHVVPRRRKDGLRGFFWPRGRYASPEEMAAVQRQIAEAVATLS